MTFCVLDASVALLWSFEDEDSPYTEFVFASLQRQRATVPIIWPLEVNNALLSAVRRGRIREEDVSRLLSVLDRLQLDVDQQIARGHAGREILRLGLSHGLSAYDASYLELAFRRGLPLATQDQRLMRAAAASGVDILRT